MPLGAYVVHQSAPAPDHLSADDAAFELAAPGETARLAFVTGLTALDGVAAVEESRADEEVATEQLPETIALPVVGGLDAYLGWIEESTSQTEEKQW